MFIRFNFEQPFAMYFYQGRNGTKDALPSKRYTNGSKLENGSTGMGIFGPNCAIKMPLGIDMTIFQAEIIAIAHCAKTIQKKSMKCVTINIFSDSQADLKALRSHTCESELVWEYFTNFKQLAKGNKVSLWWVPGHEGIHGNERTDELAKTDAMIIFIGPEPVCGLSKSYIKRSIRKWEQKEEEKLWITLPSLKHAKNFISLNNENIIKQVLNLSKKKIAIFTGLMTGYCSLRYHLQKIGIAEDQICRLCKEEFETAEHILCRCSAACQRRLTYIGIGICNTYRN